MLSVSQQDYSKSYGWTLISPEKRELGTRNNRLDLGWGGRGVIWIRILAFVFTFFYIGKVPYTMHDAVRALKNWRIATLVFHTEQNRPARTKYENRLAQIMRVVPSPWGHLPGVVVVIIISRDPIKLCTCSRVISSQPSLRRILMAFRSHNRCYSVQRSIDFLCAAQ